MKASLRRGRRNGRMPVLVGTALLTQLGSLSHAADLAIKQPIAAPSAAASWTGPYLGLSFGERWNHANWETTGVGFNGIAPFPPDVPPDAATPPLVHAGSTALRAGPYAGYNFQIAPWLLIGVEGDIAGSTSRRRIAGIPGALGTSLVSDSVTIKEGWDGSLRARAGFLITPSLLIYGTGGAAWQEFDLSANCFGTGVPGFFPNFLFQGNGWCVRTRNETASFVRTGWTAGGGLEMRFGGNWLGRVEYRYSDFGRVNHDFFTTARTFDELAVLTPASTLGSYERIVMNVPLRTQSITLGIAYQFTDAPTSTAATPAIFAKAKAAAPTPLASRWTTTLATDSRYYTWEGNRGFPTNVPAAQGSGRGSEFYNPLAMQLVGQPTDDVKVELLARGGWVWAKQTTAGLTGEVTTATDTVLSGTVTYLGFNGIQPFAGVSANLPTGQSSLHGTAVFARMDPDLVGLASFGEGFNIGPTLGFSVPVTRDLIFTTSAGYTWRGGYSRENSLAAIDPTPTAQTAVRVEPGDVATVTETFAWQWGQLKTVLTGSISGETATAENAQPIYRPGLRYLANASWTYDWRDYGATTITAAATHSNRNKVLMNGMPPLVVEAFNTNSNVWRVGLQHLFPVAMLTIGPSASYLFRDHNGYDPDSLQFVAEKQRWSGGLLARYAATDAMTLNLHVDRVWTREAENPTLPGGVKLSALTGVLVPMVAVPVVNSTGWQVTGGMNAKF